jgi:chromate reductase, NAD(P)H dehydrogenase (quinone)
MKLHGISGSLRAASTNIRLLHAARELVPANVDLMVENVISELPQFNPDIGIDSNDRLAGFVERVRDSDGIVFSSPVYAGGYPGALKNALDWLVGTDAFVEKPFIMLSASNRVPGVEQSLILVLETMGGVHVRDASTTVPLLGSSLSVANIVGDIEMSNSVRSSLTVFVRTIQQKIA